MYCTTKILPHQRDAWPTFSNENDQASECRPEQVIRGDARVVVLGSGLGCMLDGGVADAEE